MHVVPHQRDASTATKFKDPPSQIEGVVSKSIHFSYHEVHWWQLLDQPVRRIYRRQDWTLLRVASLPREAGKSAGEEASTKELLIQRHETRWEEPIDVHGQCRIVSQDGIWLPEASNDGQIGHCKGEMTAGRVACQDDLV